MTGGGSVSLDMSIALTSTQLTATAEATWSTLIQDISQVRISTGVPGN